MALILCADCGHKVSSLAIACPQCARPIAALEEARALVATRGGARVTALRAKSSAESAQPVAPFTPELASSVVAWRDQLRRVQAHDHTTTKLCLRCDADVSVDPFRRKSDAGYTCGECFDRESARSARVRAFVTRALLIVTVFVVLASLVSGAAYLANRKPPEKQASPYKR